MPKHKRHMRLPSGYGSVLYLGKGRRRPYAVYPPATQRNEEGFPIRPKALGYCETYEEGRELLAMYHKGIDLPDVQIVKKSGPTFAEVYERFYKDKYNNAAKQYSQSSKAASSKAFKNASVLHDREFASIKYPELQSVLDNCPLSYASIELIKTLIKQMYRYAEKYELIDRDESRHLEIRIPDDDEHGIPFSDDDINRIWSDALQNRPETALRLLVMIYSGFRISAYNSLTVRLGPDWYFQGGVKTKSSKNRIVPIHSGIQKIVEDLMKRDNALGITSNMNKQMQTYLPSIGITEHHTPHDCRHTFSALCEKYEVPENDRKRLLGHSFGADITNGIYGHRTIEDLRASIEKIQIPQFVVSML